MTSEFKSKITDGKPQMDRTLLVAVILLLLVGLVMVYSASNAISREYRGNSYHYLQRQALWCCIGLAAMICAAFFKYENYKRIAWLLLAIAGGLLLLVYVPGIGIKRSGGTRWVGFGRYVFQPVEVAHYMPKFNGGRAPQSNDVFVDENGLIFLLDRNRGFEILEMTL